MVVGTKPGLAAVASATVAVLSQSSGIERPFFAMRRGHVVYNNCALYMLLYKQQCSQSARVHTRPKINYRGMYVLPVVKMAAFGE